MSWHEISWILTYNKDAQWKPTEQARKKPWRNASSQRKKCLVSRNKSTSDFLLLHAHFPLLKTQFRQHLAKPVIKESRISKAVTHPEFCTVFRLGNLSDSQLNKEDGKKTAFIPGAAAGLLPTQVITVM